MVIRATEDLHGPAVLVACKQAGGAGGNLVGSRAYCGHEASVSAVRHPSMAPRSLWLVL